MKLSDFVKLYETYGDCEVTLDLPFNKLKPATGGYELEACRMFYADGVEPDEDNLPFYLYIKDQDYGCDEN